MKALVIGGTDGFGAAVADNFRTVGEVVVVGRSSSGAAPLEYVCNVADRAAWEVTLRQIQADHPVLDVIVAIVGYARLISAPLLTEEDWQLHRALNLEYAKRAYEVLEYNLRQSADPRFATLGSRWSYRTDNEYLLPYIAAKHELRAWTAELAGKNEWLRANHYCVPTMVTPQQAKLVEEAASQGYSEVLCAGNFNRAIDFHGVADQLAILIRQTEKTGQTYVIANAGNVQTMPAALSGRHIC